jgi:hypothetical protein
VSEGGSERAYARAIEAAWSRMKGRPVVLSPREFELVASWRREGISLAVVLEVLHDEARRAGGRREPRSLGVLAKSVREAGGVVAAGRATSRAKTPSAPPPAADRWRDALGGAQVEAPLRAALDRLLHASLEGARPEELDRRLDEELMRAAPADRRRAAEEASRAALAPFRARMESAEHERAVARATADRLREAYGLPRAALSPPPKIG